MMGNIYQVYAKDHDVTIIFEDTYKGSELLSTELKGFYYGEPCEKGLTTFYGETKAEFWGNE
jgi:hypothetical protein